MDLPAIISNFYSRAGFVYLTNGETGSITFIGTVSPAGGNLKEPVTESTKKVARCFYGLSQQRADSKRYPAVDPIDSYSKYLEYPEFEEYVADRISDNWIELVNHAKTVLQRGKEIYEQINILGDDGVPVEYHITFWKSEIIDFVILQQDAFDAVDQSTPIERQQYMLEHVLAVCDSNFNFESFTDVDGYFKRVINLYKQMNYSEFKSEKFNKFSDELEEVLKEKQVVSELV
jgi:V/A-type H+/Na+-transporting ATPase subunit A